MEMLNAIADSLSDLTCSNVGEDMEDDDDYEEQAQQGKLSKDDESGWVMGTVTKTVQHWKKRFRQNKIRLDQLTQPGWGRVANNYCERDMKYMTAELSCPAV